MAGRQWVRLDADYFSNPKVLRAGPDAALLHVAAICYLGAHELDDGILPAEAVPVLAVWAQVRRRGDAVDRLVKAGLWHRADDGGFIVHDYDVMNGAHASSTLARERTRRWRQRVNERKKRDDV